MRDDGPRTDGDPRPGNGVAPEPSAESPFADAVRGVEHAEAAVRERARANVRPAAAGLHRASGAPSQPSLNARRWAPSDAASTRCGPWARLAALVLVAAAFIDDGDPPWVSWWAIAALAVAAGGSWVLASAMLQSGHGVLEGIGAVLVGPAVAAWMMGQAFVGGMLLLALGGGMTVFAFALGAGAGLALGWSGATWSLVALDRMLEQIHPKGDEDATRP